MKHTLSIFVFVSAILSSTAQSPKDGYPGSKGNGAILERYEVVSKMNDTRNGHSEKWYQGVKIVSCEYLIGKKNGLWKSQSVDGKMFFQGNYSDNKKNGIWKYYKEQKRLSVVCFKNGENDSIWQSYYPNGSVWCMKSYANGKANGSCKLFYEDGKIQYEKNFKNDSLHGTYISYYPNGTILSNIEYKDGQPYNVLAMNDAQGKGLDYGTLKQGTGTLREYTRNGGKRSTTAFNKGLKEGSCIIYFDNKYSIYHYVGGEKEGESTTYFNDGSICATTEFLDQIGAGYLTDINYEKTDERLLRLMMEYDERTMPASLGGEEGLMQFIKSNFEYPNVSKTPNQQGTTYVSFTVLSDGTLKDSFIIKGVTAELDQEAIRVVSLMPPWIPGFENGLPVNIQFNLPIRFSLQR